MEPPAYAPEAIPIATLQPQLPAPAQKSIRAVVTLLWPYSSSHRSCALLLAEPDFRLRRRRGQVRVTFSGHPAHAVATSGVGIGDDVELFLAGAQWRTAGDAEVVRTPGKSVDWELDFGQRLRMRVVRDGEELASLNVSRSDSPETGNGQDGDETAEVSTPTRVVGRFSGPAAYSSESWSSPAFVKRARLSMDSLFQPTSDPFADLDNESEERSRKRRRTSFREIGVWTYAARTPSPEKEDVELAEKGQEVSTEAVRLPATPESAETPDAQVQDEEELVPETDPSVGPVETRDEVPEKPSTSMVPGEEGEPVSGGKTPSEGDNMAQAYQGLEDAMESQFFYEATHDTDMLGGDTEENTEVDEMDEEAEDNITGYSLKEAEMLQQDEPATPTNPTAIPDTFTGSSQFLTQENFAGDTEPDSDQDMVADDDHREVITTEVDSEEEAVQVPQKPAVDGLETDQPPMREQFSNEHGVGLPDETGEDDVSPHANEVRAVEKEASPLALRDTWSVNDVVEQEATNAGLPAPTMPPPPLLSLRKESPHASLTLSVATPGKEGAPITPQLQPVTSANLPLPSPFPGASDAPPPFEQHPLTDHSDVEVQPAENDKPVCEHSSPVAPDEDSYTTIGGKDIFRISGFWGMVPEDALAGANEAPAHTDEQERMDTEMFDDRHDEKFPFGLDGAATSKTAQEAQSPRETHGKLGAPEPAAMEPADEVNSANARVMQKVDAAASPAVDVQYEKPSVDPSSGHNDLAIAQAADEEMHAASHGLDMSEFSDMDPSESALAKASQLSHAQNMLDMQGPAADESMESADTVIRAASQERDVSLESDPEPDEPAFADTLQPSRAEDAREASLVGETPGLSGSLTQMQPASEDATSPGLNESAVSEPETMPIDPALLTPTAADPTHTTPEPSQAPVTVSSPPEHEPFSRSSSVREPSSSPVAELPNTWGQQTYQPSILPDLSSPPRFEPESELPPVKEEDASQGGEMEMTDAPPIYEPRPVSDDHAHDFETETVVADQKPIDSQNVDIVDLGSGSESDEEMASLTDAAPPIEGFTQADDGEVESSQDTPVPEDLTVVKRSASPGVAAVEPIQDSSPNAVDTSGAKKDDGKMGAEPHEDLLQAAKEDVPAKEVSTSSSFYAISSSPAPPPRSPSPIEHLDMSQTEPGYMSYTLSQNYPGASQNFSQQVPDFTQHPVARRWRTEVKDSEDSLDSNASISTIRDSSPAEIDERDEMEDMRPQVMISSSPMAKDPSPESENKDKEETPVEQKGGSFDNFDNVRSPRVPATPQSKQARPPPVPTHSSMMHDDSSIIREIMNQQSYPSQPSQPEPGPASSQDDVQPSISSAEKPRRQVPTHSSMLVDDFSIIRGLRTQQTGSPENTQEQETLSSIEEPVTQVYAPASTQQPTHPELPSEVPESEMSVQASALLPHEEAGSARNAHLHFTADASHVPVTPESSQQTKATQAGAYTEKAAAALLTPGLSQSSSATRRLPLDTSQAASLEPGPQDPAAAPPTQNRELAGEATASADVSTAPSQAKNRAPEQVEPAETQIRSTPEMEPTKATIHEEADMTLNGSTIVDMEASGKAAAKPFTAISSPPHTQASQGYRTSLSYYVPLANLSAHFNSQGGRVDVLGVCTRDSKAPSRAVGGPRDYNTVFHITDPSLTDTAIFQPSVTVQVFRPWKKALPVVERGDVVLLRGFVPKSRNGKAGLLSCEEAGWYVWRYGKEARDQQNGTGKSNGKTDTGAETDGGKRQSTGKPIWADQTVGLWGDATGTGWGEVANAEDASGEENSLPKEECRGPPVEVGEEERKEVRRLRDWWGESDDDDAEMRT